jgi:hypothetical protein
VETGGGCGAYMALCPCIAHLESSLLTVLAM